MPFVTYMEVIRNNLILQDARDSLFVLLSEG